MSLSRRGGGSRRSPYLIFTIIAIPLIIVLLLILALTTTWSFYWIWLVALSVITFLLYGYDKGQAKLGGLRVPEIVLHVLALLGGFPGGWVGRAVFWCATPGLSGTPNTVNLASSLLKAIPEIFACSMLWLISPSGSSQSQRIP